MPMKSPEKVLFLITKSNFGGAQKYVYELAVNAKAAGYQVVVGGGGPRARRAPPPDYWLKNWPGQRSKLIS
jgi:hypothetical protein